jgi:hypothetical protein
MTTTMMTEKQRAALEAIEAVRRERLSLKAYAEARGRHGRACRSGQTARATRRNAELLLSRPCLRCLDSILGQYGSECSPDSGS